MGEHRQFERRLVEHADSFYGQPGAVFDLASWSRTRVTVCGPAQTGTDPGGEIGAAPDPCGLGKDSLLGPGDPTSTSATKALI